MNRVILMGRLTADPDITNYGKKNEGIIARFSLAVNYSEEHTDFIRCVAFGNTAEVAEKYLQKASKILIEGRWQTGQYKNQNGDNIYTNECVINRFEFCESKKDDDTEQSSESNKTRRR